MSGRIRVPKGMLDAGFASLLPNEKDQPMAAYATFLEAALRWLSENPIEPSKAQVVALFDSFDGKRSLEVHRIVEWQRRMFLVEEPQIEPTATLSSMRCGGCGMDMFATGEMVTGTMTAVFEHGENEWCAFSGKKFSAPRFTLTEMEEKTAAAPVATIYYTQSTADDPDDPIRDLLRDEAKVDHCGQLCVDVVKVNNQMRESFKRGKESR